MATFMDIRKEKPPLPSFLVRVLYFFVNNEITNSMGAIRYIVDGSFTFYNGTSS